MIPTLHDTDPALRPAALALLKAWTQEQRANDALTAVLAEPIMDLGDKEDAEKILADAEEWTCTVATKLFDQWQHPTHPQHHAA